MRPQNSICNSLQRRDKASELRTCAIVVCIPLKGYKGSEATAPVHRDEGVSQFPDSLPLSMLTVSVGLFNSVGTRSPVVNEERSVQSSPVLLKAR